MEHYDRRTVTAPEWMERFQCLAGDCPETCCREWNIDVDPAHAEQLKHLDDPELQEKMNRILRSFRIRRAGSRQGETLHRLQLLNQPDRRCPLLNHRDECSLQKKYGAYILCDTCYFYPRTFWQIDEKTCLSACLSCSECARLALLHEEPTVFRQFPAEIDPNAEWLETEFISDPAARCLLQKRDELVSCLCRILQNRSEPLEKRIRRAGLFLDKLAAGFTRPEQSIAEFLSAAENEGIPDGAETEAGSLTENFAEIFDPVSDALEKPAQSTVKFMHQLAGGSQGYAALLAEQYEKGMKICGPFLRGKPWLAENFMVHCVFSDSFKQFFRYQNEPLSAGEILRHESALLSVWYRFFLAMLSRSALLHGEMNEELFLQTVIDGSRDWWHYPDWFARCADRLFQQ